MPRETLIFFKEFLRTFKTTGSVVPSSRWAAKALTSPIRESEAPKRILEVGPGTGSVTEQIVADLKDGDHLTVCEINPRFMKALKAKLEEDEIYRSRRNQVAFFEGSILDYHDPRKFDVIICAIPFTNMELPLVRDIFCKLENLCSLDTKLTFFEYAGLREIGKAMSPKNRRERIKAVDAYLLELSKKYPTTEKIVWLNFPPTLIHTMRIKAVAA